MQGINLYKCMKYIVLNEKNYSFESCDKVKNFVNDCLLPKPPKKFT